MGRIILNHTHKAKSLSLCPFVFFSQMAICISFVIVFSATCANMIFILLCDFVYINIRSKIILWSLNWLTISIINLCIVSLYFLYIIFAFGIHNKTKLTLFSLLKPHFFRGSANQVIFQWLQQWKNVNKLSCCILYLNDIVQTRYNYWRHFI